MRARHLLGALFTVSLLAAPAWAVDCATSGTVTVTGPAGVTSQLWLQTGNAFNVLPVQNSSIWVRTQDGTAFSVLLVINSTESTVLQDTPYSFTTR